MSSHDTDPWFSLIILFVCCLDGSNLVVTGKKAREREQKWLKMMGNWDEWMAKRKPKVCTCLCMEYVWTR